MDSMTGQRESRSPSEGRVSGRGRCEVKCAAGSSVRRGQRTVRRRVGLSVGLGLSVRLGSV